MEKNDKNNENKNVIIIQNDDGNKNKDGLTLAKYGHYVAKYKYWVTIITLLFAIIGYLFATLYYNPSKNVLTSGFELNIPIVTETTIATDPTDKNKTTTKTTTTYVDGTAFSYQSIISYDNIKYVIENTKVSDTDSTKKYNFNLDKIADKNAITIEQKVIENKDNTTTIVPNSYIIKAKTKYLGNKDNIAKEFIADLLNRSKEIALSKVAATQIDRYLPDDINSSNYSVAIDAIVNQYDAIDKFYTKSLKEFSSSIITENGKTLQQKQQNFKKRYASTSAATIVDDLESSYENNNYIKFDKEHIDDEIAKIKNEANKTSLLLKNTETDIADKTTVIENYKAAFGDKENIYSEQFEKLNAELIELQNKKTSLTKLKDRYGLLDSGNYKEGSVLDHLNKYKTNPDSEPAWVKENDEFQTKINDVYNLLKEDLTSSEGDLYYIYQKYKNEIIYDSVNVGTVSGGISAIVIALIFLILGYIISSLIFSGVGLHEDNKKKKEEGKENENKETVPSKIEKEPSDIVINSKKDDDVF